MTTRSEKKHLPTLSIVMAACNGEPFIEEQLLSILPQMKKGDELIVSIDPSRDTTEAIVRRIQSDWPQCPMRLLQGPGTGPVDNFEHALLERGLQEVVVLCDQDDRWHENKLDIIRQTFTDPAISALVHDAAICSVDLTVMEPSYFQAHGSKGGYWTNLLRNSFIGSCMALRKEVVDACLPFPKPIPMHDQLLGLQAERMGRVVFLDQVLIDYRRHDQNVSALHSKASLVTQLSWRRQMLKALRLRPPGRPLGQ